MMTLKTIIGLISSESKDYVEAEERLSEEDEAVEYDHSQVDIDLPVSSWLSGCTLVRKPLSDFRMGSCFDFGLHGSSAATTATLNKRNIERDIIASPVSSPSLSQHESKSPSSELATDKHQEDENAREKTEREERSLALEKTYVYDVYDQIAPYLRDSRNRTWPKINEFLQELDPGSLICDAGCGSGKYLDKNSEIFALGLDRCQSLAELAREKGHEVVTCDILTLPFREESFDAAISISVIHHLATTERRIEAIKELARVLRIGGRLVITVWAMEQKHRKFESQDVLVPWHKPVRVSSEDQTSIEKDMTSTTTNSEEDILNYHAYTSGSEPSVLSFPIRKRPKFRESWLSRHRFSEGGQINRRSSSQSSSDLSSPNESCYSFLRRALQKLSWGSGESYKSNNPNSWLNPGINSLDQFGSLNNFERECLNISTNDCQIETKNRLNAELDKQDSLDSNENADDIPIELYDVDGDHSYQVPPEVSRIRQRRGTFSSDNNDSFKRRISQSFERTASLKDSVLNRRRNRSLKVRLKRSASTDSPNSHSVAPKSRSLSDLLNLFSATFLQYSRKTSQDTTSGSSSSFTKHSSNSSVDSKGSRTVPLSKSNIFTLAKVEEGNENYNSINSTIVNNNNDELAIEKKSSCPSGSETKLVVKLADKGVEKRTCHTSDRKVRPRSLILNRERKLTTIPRTLSMEDYQNGNHILLDYDTDFSYRPASFHDILPVKKTRDMSTQFDYFSSEETKKTCKYFDNYERRDSDPKDYVKLRKNRNLSGRLTKSENAVDNRFIDRIINRDHLFPSHSMPNLHHFQSSDSNPDAKKRDSFVLLSSKAKFLMEMTPHHPDNSPNNRYSFNIKGFRRLSQPCMQLNSITREDSMPGKSRNCDNDSQRKCGGGSCRWASLLRRHSSFSVMKQCHMQQVIKHSYSTGDSTFAESGENIGEANCQSLANNHSNNKFIKEDSLQSDTSVDSDDSVASVIAVRHKSTDANSRASSVKRNSLCSTTKSSSKEGSDTSFDSEESCVSVIANEALAVKALMMEENIVEANDTITEEIDVKWEKYMDASESLALDSIFYVNIEHQPDMETIMKEDDYYLPHWTNIECEDFDYDIVGVAAVEYHNTAEKLSLAETCWLDSSSSCKSGDHDEDLLERRLQLDINCSLDLYQTSSNDDNAGSSGRLLDAAVDVANSLQSAVEVAVVSNRKCNEASIDFSSIVTICNQKLIMEDVAEEDICENNEINNSLTNIEMSMSISHEETDFYINEEPDVVDSFEESQWRVREDVINGNISQANLKLFQKMLQNASNEASMCRSSRNKTTELKKHRRKSDSEAGSQRASTIFSSLSKCSNSKSSAISRGKSLDFYVVTDQSMFKDTRRPSAILDIDESDRLTKYLESSENFFTSKDEMEQNDFSEKGRKRLKSQNNVGVISAAAHSDDPAWEIAEKSGVNLKGKGHHQDTLSVSTSEDSILSGSENCGSTSHHRYYHVFREGELDYLIENYVENLHIISSYYDHSNWCVIAEKVQVWKI